MRPIVLTIAGSDNSAGAGLQADLKAIEANGGYAVTVVTAVTVQNGHGVCDTLALEPQWVRAQLEALFADFPIAAVKTGLLPNAAVVCVVSEFLERFPVTHRVCDPVLRAQRGQPLADEAVVEHLRRLLLPRVSLVTPNLFEAEQLAGQRIDGRVTAERAARAIRAFGPAAVLVTGGHLAEDQAVDVLYDGTETHTFAAARLDTPHTHGSGCAYASAIAAQLARGRSVVEAVRRAKRFITEAIRHGLPLASGYGPVDPLWRMHRRSKASRVGGSDER